MKENTQRFTNNHSKVSSFKRNADLSIAASVDTPVHVSRLNSAVSLHPNQSFVNDVVQGLTFGFGIKVESAISPSAQHYNCLP